MKITTKLVLGASLLALVPVIVSNTLIEVTATSTSHVALEQASEDRLKGIRDTTKARLSDYFNNIENLIITLSSNPATAQAAMSFSEAYRDHAAEAGTLGKIDQFKEDVSGFYKTQFQQQYRTLNPGKNAPVDQWLSQMSDKAIELQHVFIANNPNPLGNKHQLIDIQDYTTYEQFHELFHPVMVQYLESFGFYDIFIVDPKHGQIVYSVFKEVDYGTSLLTGPFKDTGIADAYQRVKDAPDSNAIAFTDFAPYPPSYEAPASFMATPIKDSDELYGVLIFQIPLNTINEIMTHHKDWEEVGLGKSGETYLVGSDNTLRSDSRFFLEDQDGFTELLSGLGIAQGSLDLMKAKSSGIGIHAIEGASLEEAQKGNSGFHIVEDYRKEKVLSAYTPFTFHGVTWALLAEIDKAEAFASADEVSHKILMNSIIVFLVVALLAIISSYLFSKTLSNPVIRLRNHLMNVGQNSDLTLELSTQGNDEIAEITNNFNTMVGQFRKSLQKVAQASEQLSVASSQTMTATDQTTRRAQEQLSQSSQATTAMNEMTATVQEVANHTTEAAEATTLANDATLKGQQNVETLIATIESLAARLSAAGEVTDRLAKESEQINTVVDVIQSIAEQTNLLALNAAIEAARAGEQGRGFAVVADEVRSLAGKTHDSTQEINQMMEALQTGSKDTVDAIEASLSEVQQAVAKAGDAGESLNEITSSVETVNSMNLQIATTAEEQISVSEEINLNITQIAEMAEHTDEDAKQTSASAESVSKLSQQLSDLIGRFKI